MKKKFNKIMTISLLTSILIILFGLCLVFYTKISMESIAYMISLILILNGLLSIIDDYKEFRVFYFFDGFTTGLISIIFGIIILVNPDYFSLLIPIILGLWFIINSIFKLRISLALKETNNSYWIFSYLISIFIIIMGLYLIFNPEYTSILITKTIGIISIIYALFDIVDILLLKKNIKDIMTILK